MDTAKICKKCGRKLPIDKFGINHNYTRCVCKECFNEGMREKRYQQRLSDSIETYHKDKKILVVSHGAVIRGLHHLLNKTDLNGNLTNFKIDNCYIEKINTK